MQWISAGVAARTKRINNISNWTSYIDKKYNRDAIGRKLDEYQDLIDRFTIQTSEDYNAEFVATLGNADRTHGHHIVYKEASDSAREPALRAKDVLIYFGIDAFFGNENLVYAPNRGHTTDGIVDLANRLETIYAQFGGSSATYDAGRSAVIARLRSHAATFIGFPGFPGT